MKRYLILLAVLFLPVLIYAQGTTSGTIEGTIVDAQDEPLPGANIVAIHQPTGSRYGTSSRANGRYTLKNLRVGGPYEVQVTFIGFNAQKKEIPGIELGETVELHFTLQEGALELEEISVTAQADPVFNADRTGASTNISREDIDNTPTISRSLQDFTRLNPQVTSGFSFGGANARYNNILVDGSTLNDVFGLGEGVPGSGAGVTSPISIDAIQEFNVDIAPFDVTNNGFTGGQVNAITKSGTNNYAGSVYYQLRNESFVGNYRYERVDDTYLSNDYPSFDESYVGLNIGGPIVQDKLFFFINGEFRRESNPLTTGIAGSGAPNEFPLGESVFSEIQNIAVDEYGYNPGGYGLITPARDNNKLLAKLDWNINQNNKFTFRYNFVDAVSEEGVERYSDSYSYNNSQYNFESVQNSVVAQLNSNISENIFNEARVVYTRIRDSRNVVGSPFPFVAIEDTSLGVRINLGTEQYSHANRLDQDLVEITNNLTYINGNHEFTFGTSNQIYKFDNLFVRNYFGAYEFESIEDWRNGDPSSFELSYLLPDGNPTANFSGIQLGFYAQDKWSVNNYLKLTFGLRADVPILPDKPTYNPKIQLATVEGNPDQPAFPDYSTTRVSSGNILWSPRFGFNWDLSRGGRTTQVRGGIGIFSGNPPFVWISNQYGNTGVDYGRIDLSGDDLPAGFQFEPDPDNQPTDLEGISTTEVNLVTEDFKYPQSLKFNLAVDQQLPMGVVGTVEGVYSKMLNEVTFRNINLVQTGESAYGRPLYGDNSGSTVRVDGENFTDVILMDNTSKGYQFSLTGQLEKQFDWGLHASIAYTYNRAETINNGSSSQARSNWIYNENVDINNPALGPADYERRHRILGQLSYSVAYADRFATTISLIYDGRSGTPFSWIYYGDANGDGERFNDLIYVPASEEEVVMASNNWKEFDNWISNNESVNKYRGDHVERGSAREPWTNFLDLRVNQEINTIAGQKLELTASVFNVLNLLNNEWGVRKYASGGYNNYSAVTINGYDNAGRPIIEFNPDYLTDEELYDVSDLGSRWQLQLGVRYSF